MQLAYSKVLFYDLTKQVRASPVLMLAINNITLQNTNETMSKD
jgi:hypothetical protein